MTKKQRRAYRREKAKAKRARNVQKATAVNMQTVRAGAHTAAREPMPRFEVDPARRWYVVRALPRWSARAAEQIRGAGIPVFEAREAVRIVSDIGKVRIAQIPVLRRLLFVGIVEWQELLKVESHPGVHDDATRHRRSGLVEAPGGGSMVIRPADLQNFADCITGHGGSLEAARVMLFTIGEVVRVTDGAFASFPGTVEEIDNARGRLRVAVGIFGRATPVELEFSQVEAA